MTTKIEAVEYLKDIFPRGTKVYTILRHTSKSGMTRAISVVAVQGDTVRDVSYLVASLGLFKSHTNYQGLKVGGCGMDMGFHVAYSLSQALYNDGYALTHSWL